MTEPVSDERAQQVEPRSRLWWALRKDWICVPASQVRKGDQLANHGTITVSRKARMSDIFVDRQGVVHFPKTNGVPHPLSECWKWAAGKGYSGVTTATAPMVVGRLRRPAVSGRSANSQSPTNSSRVGSNDD